MIKVLETLCQQKVAWYKYFYFIFNCQTVKSKLIQFVESVCCKKWWSCFWQRNCHDWIPHSKERTLDRGGILHWYGAIILHVLSIWANLPRLSDLALDIILSTTLSKILNEREWQLPFGSEYMGLDICL